MNVAKERKSKIDAGEDVSGEEMRNAGLLRNRYGKAIPPTVKRPK